MSEGRNDSGVSASADEMDRMEECGEWLAFAQTDYDCADYLFRAPLSPRPLNVICYHCQQAAEKAIKALIVYCGNQGGIPKVHDLSFLLNQVRNTLYDQKGIRIDREFMATVDGLSKYGVAPRYPNEMDVDERQASKVLRDSARIVAWVRRVIAADGVKKDE